MRLFGEAVRGKPGGGRGMEGERGRCRAERQRRTYGEGTKELVEC